MRQYAEKSWGWGETLSTAVFLDSLNTEVVTRILLLALTQFLSELCINYTYRGQVVLNILMTRGILEQRACLDTLLALLVNCSGNLTVRDLLVEHGTLLLFFLQFVCSSFRACISFDLFLLASLFVGFQRTRWTKQNCCHCKRCK